MPYGIMAQKRHRHLPSPALAWFRLHFRESGFNGRFQIGFRRPDSSSILPLTTQPIDKLPDFVESAHFSRRLDYYITANSVAGVQRRKEGLFSLHNIVIDIDLHVKDELPDSEDAQEGERMFFNEEPLHAFLSRLRDSVSAEDGFPSPTSVVWTGRGLQLWWAVVPMSGKCLPWYEEVRDTLILRVRDLIEENSSELGDLRVDSSASRNAVGYFRLPGTVNSHSQTMVKAEIWTETQYDTHELIKWAKQYKSERVEDEENVNVCTDTDPFSYSDVEVRILKNVFTTAFFRVRQMIRLRAIRDDRIGDETRNNMCLIVFNAMLLSCGEAKAWEKVLAFNAGFKKPMEERELHNSLDTSVKKGGYRYKNETVISFLGVTETEQEQIGLYPGGSSFPRLSQHPSRTAARKLAKQHRNDRISELSMSGKKNKEIAAELGIALNTVTTVLGARRPRREEAWVMKRDGFGKDEIAEKLGVSVRTVERYLGAEPAQQPSPAGPESGSIDKKSEKPSQQNNLSSSDAGSSYELSGSREKETTPNSTKDVPPSDDNKDFSSETYPQSRPSPPPFFMRRRINPHKRAKKAEEEATNLDDSPSDSS